MNPVERATVWVLRRLVRVGTLAVRTPRGEDVVLGSGEPRADLALRDSSALTDILRRGALGFADAYMDGRAETSDLAGLLRWGVANYEAWIGSAVARIAAPLRRGWLRLRPERRHPRVQSMVDHYDLGNSFYESWLDATMTYSSARFVHPDQPLDEAQHHKYQTVAGHAGLASGMRVLEIGCGWGGFAEYAAGELGCTVVGVTVSPAQAEYARRRVADRGLSELVDIRLEDFRATTGTFDAVVSIEMIESIDERQWPDLFDTIAARLAPEGRAVVQAITIDDRFWEEYRRRVDFIQQYIFPGGQLPAPKVLRSLAGRVELWVEQVETFGLDYARTLARWRERFTAAWPELQGRDGLDERFRRMWDLYLVLCEAGFMTGRVDVQQWVFAAPGRAGASAATGESPAAAPSD